MKRFIIIFVFVTLFSCGGEEKPLHAAFDLKIEELEELTAGLSGKTQKKIFDAPEEFLELFLQVTREPAEYLWLVDKKHSLPPDYAPEDMVDLADYPLKITKKSLMVRKVIMDDLLAMIKAAKADGVEISCASTYRSYKRQEWLFAYWVKQLGQEEAEITSARPGLSQHQLGTTIDFAPIDISIETTAAGKWLLDNALKYGFSLSYPRGYDDLTGYTYEPWHYRYVGRLIAIVIASYFDGIQQNFLEFYNKEGKILKDKIKFEEPPGVP